MPISAVLTSLSHALSHASFHCPMAYGLPVHIYIHVYVFFSLSSRGGQLSFDLLAEVLQSLSSFGHGGLELFDGKFLQGGPKR